MRIKRQRETFAYRLANPFDLVNVDDTRRRRDDNGANAIPDTEKERNLNALPESADPSRYEGYADAVGENASGKRMPKMVVTPGVSGRGSGSGGSNSSSGYRGNGKGGRDGLNPGAMSFYDELAAEHPDLAMGGYNPTVDQSWDEHQTGNAIDVMVSDLERGNAIRDRALSRPDIRHVIWQQQLFRPDGSSYTMENRGSPTENHFDHVHIMLNG